MIESLVFAVVGSGAGAAVLRRRVLGVELSSDAAADRSAGELAVRIFFEASLFAAAGLSAVFFGPAFAALVAAFAGSALAVLDGAFAVAFLAGELVELSVLAAADRAAGDLPVRIVVAASVLLSGAAVLALPFAEAFAAFGSAFAAFAGAAFAGAAFLAAGFDAAVFEAEALGAAALGAAAFGALLVAARTAIACARGGVLVSSLFISLGPSGRFEAGLNERPHMQPVPPSRSQVPVAPRGVRNRVMRWIPQEWGQV